MAKKVFRIHTSGASHNIEGWDKSIKMGSAAIESIADPNGASAEKEITSIPSPFARIDLVKTAFENVTRKTNGEYTEIDKATIYNKMVSHSLDVGQIFFEYDKWHDKVEIIAWDKDEDLKKLLDSPISSHRQLGATYQLFLRQDSATYNFAQLKRIYLLNYKRGPKNVNIIGATSPTTLFFCSANEINYVNDIIFGTDRPFDNDYLPLYKREIEYHKYLTYLQKTIPGFATLFPEFNEYLNACFMLSDMNRKAELQSVTKESPYEDLTLNNSNNMVEILGFNLKKKIQNTGDIAAKSDFVIASRICDDKPLVLPVDRFTQNYYYTVSSWDSRNKSAYYDPRPIQERTLPFDGSKYPYLTVCDFLEDTLIATKESVNKKAYFDGNLESSKDGGFLIPLKPLFFKYFTARDLMGSVIPGGPKMIEIKTNAANVEVVLRIPVRKGFIEYKRFYYTSLENPQAETRNEGTVRTCEFAFAMVSNIRYTSEDRAYYRLGLISRFDTSSGINLNCYLGENKVDATRVQRNGSSDTVEKCETYVLNQKAFDFVRITNLGSSGLIIPKFQEESGHDVYTFAVDFGTTNTHVEFRVNEGDSQSLDINKDDLQVQHLGKYNLVTQYRFDADFYPEIIGKQSVYDFSFPIRTILSSAKNADWKQAVYPLAHANIPFTYEHRQEYSYNEVMTNLKWSNDPENVKRIQCYIENLMLILRNKVILNHGDLTKTKLIWFYPISMTFNRFNDFRNIWDASFKKYFNATGDIMPVSMTESVAPYEYFKGKYGNANIVTIDIGGGTTDVVFANHGSVQGITSFRFAANAVFGNGYESIVATQHNGIISQFSDYYKEVFEKNDLQELLDIYETLDRRKKSNDMASFFFSLSSNKSVKDKNLTSDVDFNALLRLDKYQKTVFLIFYTAIMYHVATIMKAKEARFGIPRYIAFSGNGSKVVSILQSDAQILGNYTKLIFEKVFEKSYPVDGLDIILNAENPKEVTCKGGVSNPLTQRYEDLATTKVVLRGTDGTTFVKDTDRYACVGERDFDKVTSEVNKFFEFMFSLNRSFSFSNYFGVDNNSILRAKEVCSHDIKTFTENGFDDKMREAIAEDTVEETLFFYPIIGVLKGLASKNETAYRESQN